MKSWGLIESKIQFSMTSASYYYTNFSRPLFPNLTLPSPFRSCLSGQLLPQNLCNSANLPKKLQGPTANSVKG